MSTVKTPKAVKPAAHHKADAPAATPSAPKAETAKEKKVDLMSTTELTAAGYNVMQLPQFGMHGGKLHQMVTASKQDENGILTTTAGYHPVGELTAEDFKKRTKRHHKIETGEDVKADGSPLDPNEEKEDTAPEKTDKDIEIGQSLVSDPSRVRTENTKFDDQGKAKADPDANGIIPPVEGSTGTGAAPIV